MNRKQTLIGLTMSGLLVFVTGCNKTDTTTTPASRETEKPVNAARIEDPKASEPIAPPATNVSPSLDQGKLTNAPAMKPTDAVPTPALDAVTQKVDAANAAPTNAPGLIGQASASLTVLSQDQMAQGLREALGKGLQQAISQLGRDGGFLTNFNVKIPMPASLQKVESALRTMKQDQLVDNFVITMNHAAEQAVPEAGSVFADALKQMSIEDAKSILSGPSDAATQYFQRTTQTNLYAKFYPIVKKATENAGVTAAYKNLMDKANVGNLTQKLGGLGGLLGSSPVAQDTTDIDAYVTNKAMDGLFKMVAEEEKQIRQNPVARTTDLLQKVFGAVKK
jgi:hypothetical protein